MRVAQYRYNSMSQYAYDYQSLTLHDLNNLVYLRSDIHQAFDDKGFVFIPKAGCVSIYFLRQADQLTGAFHMRRPVGNDLQTNKEHAFARLAWAIFPLGISLTPGIAIRMRNQETHRWEVKPSREVFPESLHAGVSLRQSEAKKRRRTTPTAIGAGIVSATRTNLERSIEAMEMQLQALRAQARGLVTFSGDLEFDGSDGSESESAESVGKDFHLVSRQSEPQMWGP